MAHVLELSTLLAVKQSALLAQDGQGGNAFVQRDLVLGGDVQIRVHVADVDVDEDKVGFEDGPVFGVVEVKIEHPAVAAPVAAEIEQDALVRSRGGSKGGSQIGFGLGRIGIDVA